MKTASTHLMLMAKAPVAGRVKTRLAKHCGEVKAAEIAAELITLSVARCSEVWKHNMTLCVDGGDHEFILEVAKGFSIPVIEQTQGDLGERMLAALRYGLDKADSAAVMGCDVPQCPAATLALAKENISQGKNVIGPCTDGGYYFLATRKTHNKMFQNTSWSTEQTLEQTISSCAAAGIEFDTRLPELRDIDHWDDLVAAARDRAELKRFLASDLSAA